jgi:hypothetical protein
MKQKAKKNMSNPVPPKSHDDLVKENQELRTALDAALRALTPFEEPGRHFGSPLFVSLACVLTGDADQACWNVIDDYLEEERKREAAGIPVEHVKTVDVTVKIGKQLDSYMLPHDVVDNQAVHRVIEMLRDKPESHLRMMTTGQLKTMVDSDLHDAELRAAIKILERADVDILTEAWIFTDPNDDAEYSLDNMERKQVLETGIFVHPDRGVIVENFRDNLQVFHALNTENEEFMSWKADFTPATMKI